MDRHRCYCGGTEDQSNEVDVDVVLEKIAAVRELLPTIPKVAKDSNQTPKWKRFLCSSPKNATITQEEAIETLSEIVAKVEIGNVESIVKRLNALLYRCIVASTKKELEDLSNE